MFNKKHYLSAVYSALWQAGLFAVFIVLLSLTISCKKDSPTSSKPKTVPNEFSMNFTNKYFLGNGWVILHSLDGKSAKAAQQFSGDDFIDFGSLDTNRVTVTTIELTGNNKSVSIQLTTDYDAPAGDWTLKGYNRYYRGQIQLHRYFPYGQYDYAPSSVPGLLYLRGAITGSEDLSSGLVYYLDENDKMSIFGSVYKTNSDTSYCGWLLDQDFVPDSTYELNMFTPMQTKTVTTSRPFDFVVVAAISGSLFHWFGQSWYTYPDALTNHFIHFTTQFPYSVLNFQGIFYGGEYSYFYNYKKDRSIPSQIIVPEASVNAGYNISLNRFENISVSGAADQLRATWEASSGNINVNWTIYAPTSMKNIPLPFIPDSVLSGIGVFPLPRLNPDLISMIDYDTAKNMDDIINLVFKTNKIFSSLYNTSYSYSQYFTSKRKQQSKNGDDYIEETH